MESTTKNLYDGIPTRLTQARERCGLTVTEMSQRAGLDRKSCLKIEAGRARGNVRWHTVERLSRALGVSPSWLAFEAKDGAARVKELLARLVQAKRTRLLLCQWISASRRPSEYGHSAWYLPQRTCEPGARLRSAPAAARTELAVVPPAAQALVVPSSTPQPISPEVLPALGPQYAPVLRALGPGLSHLRRCELGCWLLNLTSVEPAQRDAQLLYVRLLRQMLEFLLPEGDHPAIDLVMYDLESPEPQARILMALSLLIEAGLPFPPGYVPQSFPALEGGRGGRALEWLSQTLLQMERARRAADDDDDDE